MRYLPPEKRLPMAEAEQIIQDPYTGLSLGWLRLVIVAKGCAECGFGPVPMILVHGVSGAAKTAVLSIAGSALGSLPFSLVSQKRDAHGEAFGAASQKSSFIFMDEVFKNDEEARFLLDIRPKLLAITRKYDYRELYVGNVSVEFNSAIVLTDTDLPQDLADDEQIGRRVIYVTLPARVPDWKLTKIDWLDYWCHTEQHQKAFETVYSDIVDRFFYAGATIDFQAMAEELGFVTYEQHLLRTENGQYLIDRIRELFWAIIHPENETLPDSAKKGKGYRKIDITNSSHRITRAINALCTQAGRATTYAFEIARKYNGRWNQVAEVPAATHFEQMTHGGNTYVRFVSGATRNAITNENLLKPEHLAEFLAKEQGESTNNQSAGTAAGAAP
jgi:hypothetical protein